MTDTATYISWGLATMMLKREIITNGEGKAEPKRCSTRLLAKFTPAKVVKKAIGKEKSSDKNSAAKREEGSKKQTGEVADQQTTDLLAENGETENQSPAYEEEKEAKSN